MIKILSKLGIEGNFLDFVKNIYRKPEADIHDGEKFNTFPLRSGTRQARCDIKGI